MMRCGQVPEAAGSFQIHAVMLLFCLSCSLLQGQQRAWVSAPNSTSRTFNHCVSRASPQDEVPVTSGWAGQMNGNPE